MVLHVVLLEGDGHWYPEGEIRKDAKQTIRHGVKVAKHDVVRDVVDGKREGVVNDSAQEVGDEYDPGVGELTDVVARHHLKHDHGRDYVLEVGVRAHQFLYLGVFLCRAERKVVVCE